MSNILDCSSFESARKSVAAIFGIDDTKLMDFLKSIEFLPAAEEFTKFIYSKVCSEFGAPINHHHTVWFHGTRALNAESFNVKGILPKSAAREHVESILLPLAVGIEKIGKNPFSLSLVGKQTKADEGPFAVLIKDAAVYATGCAHSYIDAPEMVEDIAGSLLGTNYIHLVKRFQEITKPYVVSFIEQAETYELRHAVWYLYLIASGEDIIESASSANTCFDAAGHVVKPEKIRAIQELENV